MKYAKKYGMEAAFLIVAVVCGALMYFVFLSGASIAQAETEDSASNIQALCEEFTKEISLQQEADKTVEQYESYIDERFQIGNTNAEAGITDGWLFQIVPIEVFDM